VLGVEHADHKVQDLSQEDQYTETAKMHAERVLDKLFGGLQWTVAYQWPSSCTKGMKAADDHPRISLRTTRGLGSPRPAAGAASL
jgi:hypothetical protein